MLFQNLKTASPSRKTTSGFTLVEMLVVIVVIGILAAIAVPIFLSQSDKANDAALQSDLSNAARMLAVAEASGVALPSSLPAGQVTDLGAAGTITPSATLTVSGSGASLCVEGTSDSGNVYSADLANGLRNFDCDGNPGGGSSSEDSATVLNVDLGQDAYLTPASLVDAYLVSVQDGASTSVTLTLDDAVTRDSIETNDYGTTTSHKTVWTKFVSPSTREVTITLDGADTVMGVFDANGTLIDGNDGYGSHDGCVDNGCSRVTFTADAGQTYFISNGNYSYANATLTLTIDLRMPPLLLAYSDTSFTAGSNNEALAATVTGGEGTKTYSITGTLPTGVTFDSATGTFTGPVASAWEPGGFEPVTGTGTGTQAGFRVAAFPDGSAIVVGQTRNNIDFGSFTINHPNPGNPQFFIAKVNSDSTWAWAQIPGTGIANSRESTDIVPLTDGSGAAIVTMPLTGSATLGSTTLTSAGNQDAIVAKVNSDGTWAWATRIGATAWDLGKTLFVNADGSIFLVGTSNSDTSIAGTNLTAGTWIAKIASNGTVQWARQVGSTSQTYAVAVNGLADGSAVVAGWFHGAGGATTFGATTLTSAGGEDIFIANISANGTWTSASRTGSANREIIGYADGLPDGSMLVAGRLFSGTTIAGTTLTSAGLDDVFVAKANPSGNFEWVIGGGGTSGDYAHDIVALADGSALITGRFTGPATFGSTTLVSVGGEDVFVAKVDSNGSWAWATSANGASSDEGHGISAMSDGSALVTGSYWGLFGINFGSKNLPGGLDHEELFVAQINADGTWATGEATLPGLPTTVDVTVTDSTGSTTESVTLSVG